MMMPTIHIFALMTALLPAAEVRLNGDLKLSGELKGMDHTGAIELQSPLSTQPIFIQAAAVETILFDTRSEPTCISEQNIELKNGDVLPVHIVSMDEQFLNVESPYIGAIAVPRATLAKLNLGLSREKTVYAHADDYEAWEHENPNSPSWISTKNGFSAQSDGGIFREIEMPLESKIRFSLTWKSKPNLQCVFAESTESDRYVFDFSGSRVAMYRESLNQRTLLVSVNQLKPRLIGKRLDVEIRMDRSRGLFELRINDEFEGRFTDPISPLPSGRRLRLINHAPQESEQLVQGLEIIEWDEQADRHRSKEDSTETHDSLIGRNGEKLAGRLHAIRGSGSATAFLYQTDFQDDVLELPETEVSNVFMKKSEAASKLSKSNGLILQLRGNGSLRLDSIVFKEKIVEAIHPLLGKLQISQDSLISLVRADLQKEITLHRP